MSAKTMASIHSLVADFFFAVADFFLCLGLARLPKFQIHMLKFNELINDTYLHGRGQGN